MPPTKPSSVFRNRASRFRLKKDRDDHAFPLVDMVRVFTHSPLTTPGVGSFDCGIYAAPCVVLRGYRLQPTDGSLFSVIASAEHNLVGRMVELHPLELARLDDVAEHAGDYHRFLAEVVGPATGTVFSCWVFQHRAHATLVELKTSVTELPDANVSHRRLLNK